MAKVEFDMSDLDRWTDVLVRAPVKLHAGAKAVITRGAQNIKTEARANAPRGPHTPYYPNSINYDVFSEPNGYMAEIGPAEGRRQRGLGNLLEYGSAHNPPHPHLEPALDHEEPRFLAACEALCAAVLE